MTVANLRIAHLESGDRLVKDMRCGCRVWPMFVDQPFGAPCGYCGEPVTDIPDDDE